MASLTVDFITSPTVPLKGGNIDVYNVQLSAEGEVYSGGNIPRSEASRYTVSSAVHQP